uniref:Transposase n=1 Tax=Panagrellus redivivus TaxID=6233 RepID=A0A7E4VMB8_PANRE
MNHSDDGGVKTKIDSVHLTRSLHHKKKFKPLNKRHTRLHRIYGKCACAIDGVDRSPLSPTPSPTTIIPKLFARHRLRRKISIHNYTLRTVETVRYGLVVVFLAAITTTYKKGVVYSLRNEKTT